LNAIVAKVNFVFVGTADAVLQSVRNAWMKIYGVCHAMLLHGNVRIAVNKMVLEINKRNLPDSKIRKVSFYL
jgi:hypothetical protein